MSTRPACFFLAAALAACGGDDDEPASSWDTNGSFSAECNAGASMTYAAQLSGTGFAELDGKTLYAVTEMKLASAPGTCRTAISAVIAGGAFDVRLIGRSDGAAYPFVGGFIDLDGDGACDGAVDMIWGDLQAIPPPDEVSFALGPEDFGPSRVDDCPRMISAFPAD